MPDNHTLTLSLLFTDAVVLLAEDRKLHSHLKAMNIKTDTLHHAEHNRHCPVRVLPARYLGRVYKKLGICEKVSLTGRPHRKLGVIATSQLYSYSYHSRQMMVAFTPSVSGIGCFKSTCRMLWLVLSKD